MGRDAGNKVEAINQILYRYWDPIGVSDYGGPEDEYLKYAIEIESRLSLGATVRDIYNYLVECNETTIGLPVDTKAAACAADLISGRVADIRNDGG